MVVRVRERSTVDEAVAAVELEGVVVRVALVVLVLDDTEDALTLGVTSPNRHVACVRFPETGILRGVTCCCC